MRPCLCGHPYDDHDEEQLWSNQELTKTRPCCNCAQCGDYKPKVEAMR